MYELWIWTKQELGPRKIAEFTSVPLAKSWISKMLDMNFVTDYAVLKIESFVYGGD